MLRRLLIFMAAMASVFAAFAAKQTDSYARPDFAFPTKVSSDARAMLGKALADDNGRLALRALINLSISLTDVDPDSAATVIADCRRAAAALSHPADKALTNLLTAKIYHTLFKQDSWKYLQRKQPAAPTSDYKLWSGTQWRDTITALVDSAVARPDALASVSLAKYSKVISVDSRIADMYPSVLDFVADQATGMLSRIGDIDMLPVRLICPWNDFMTMRITLSKPAAQRILDIYSIIR